VGWRGFKVWAEVWAVCEVYEVWADRWAVCEVYEVWAVKPKVL
jgi:hypothetical protein